MPWKGKLDLIFFWFNKIIKSKSKIFLSCLTAFILGIALARFWSVDDLIAFTGLLIATFLMMIFWRRNQARFLFLFIILFLFGFWRFQVSNPDFSEINKIYHYNNQSVSFVGQIKNIDRRVINQKLTIESEEVKIDGKKHEVSGSVLVSLPLYPEYVINQQVAVYCRLMKPEKIEDFDYEKYLGRYGIYSVCSFSQISVIKQPEQNLCSVFSSLLDRFRIWLNDPVVKAMTEPQASILQAMITGSRGGIPQYWLDKFSAAGISHIIAISGTNITIMATMFMFVSLNIGINRKRAFWLAAGGIFIFLLVVGDQASAIRAGIMGIVMLYGKKIGRLGGALNAILFSAALMLIVNPQLLFYDAGFQLSYLAFIGIVYLAPLVTPAFSRLPDFLEIREMVIMTISAQIITLPLILFSFHRLSVVALIVNILVLPVIPFLTVYGLVNVLAGAIWLPLGKILGFVSWLAIGYIMKIAEWGTSLPYASLELKNFNSMFLIISYLGITFWLSWPIIKKQKNNE